MALFYSGGSIGRKRELEDQPQLAGRLFRQQMNGNPPVPTPDQGVPTPEQTVAQDVSSEAQPRLFTQEQSNQPSKGLGFMKNLGYSFLDRLLPGFARRAEGTDEGTLQEKKYEAELAQQKSNDAYRNAMLGLETGKLGLEGQKTEALKKHLEHLDEKPTKLENESPSSEETEGFQSLSKASQNDLAGMSDQDLAVHAGSRDRRVSAAARFMQKQRKGARTKPQELTTTPFTPEEP